ncbi:dTDP-4-dehydrorhamnose 3,5-epimerase family protein [Desulfoluna spongiiphila]|uniref:dTDP-4-dehydrorhamnose 3,5-epimerase n=1 Tax=Desulfoluna spongiiphila TaxID=419481 RepID=A0A1G5F541_9BACT|nr:dTDP-4-dehydrorhamnose 3,5-epimerase family protein [Desulfoluna spongiiphila]SCY34211.1 dTDP-4-dehydrorhamnose 3,5-epimerase [Desulfoluna spongiiphila]
MAQVLSMNEYDEMDRPRIQTLPGFYGDSLIEGVLIKSLDVFSDERGYLMEIMRFNDEPMNAGEIKQAIASYSHPGMVKGWHLHSVQEDHLVCVTGMIKLVLYDYREDSPTYGVLNEIFMGERNPRAVFIPPGIFHGTKNIGSGISLVIGMPSVYYDPDNVDERRLSPTDNDIIPYDWECRLE